jgi:hypothetical protein
MPNGSSFWLFGFHTRSILYIPKCNHHGVSVLSCFMMMDEYDHRLLKLGWFAEALVFAISSSSSGSLTAV